MTAVTLKAHYDGKQVCLDEPCDLQPGAKLTVTVISCSDDALEEEGEAWYVLSQQGLARAYGDDEPDYSDAVLREELPRS